MIDKSALIGLRVTDVNTRAIGTIEYVNDGYVAIDFHGVIRKYAYPFAFARILELEDETIQLEIQENGMESAFSVFKKVYQKSIGNEIDYLKETGGKRYRIIDGELITSKNGEYLYAFETDTELHLPDGTAIKLWFPENIVPAYVVSCEEFTIIIRTVEYIGENVDSVEFTSEQWQLLVSLLERLGEMEPNENSLAYEIVCNAKSKIIQWQGIKCGQNIALNRATSEKITFIWGPPGTGKTETLANIALEHIECGRRVLMLSYSNVSVDGALLRVAKKADLPDGKIIRYGYPRVKELSESKSLTSYQYVLHKNPQKTALYHELCEKKRKLNRKDLERVEITKKINRIREYLLEQEKELVHRASFVATTVTKATVDKAIYMQEFDVVIFDEASMAYVPQVVFAAGLARNFFICLGDFYQLPAIVQNGTDDLLLKDIFEYTGIKTAVENDQGHEWLVLLDLQYRMHPDIANFVSCNMYHNMLRTSERIIDSRNEIAMCHPCPDSAMSMVDLSDMYSVCTKTMDGSRVNIMSALVCIRMAELNIDRYEVGIITPYSAQSRLILSMIRDIQEHDKRWLNVSCATVHQFQGSEKPVIIYDAVDCFRMPYPGILLTSIKNDTANRLFNVAVTRAKGKFILVANVGYLKRKNISKKLVFAKAIDDIYKDKHTINGFTVLDEIMPIDESEDPFVYVEDRTKSWERFISDIRNAKKNIQIDLPDVIVDSDEAIDVLVATITEMNNIGIDISIRVVDDLEMPKELQKYVRIFPYVTNPVTIIDEKTIWFGQPLYAADFISEGEILDTKYFPCFRFSGTHVAKQIQALLEMKK